MKKFKSLVAIALVVASFTSCSKDESLTTEVQNKDILSFNSDKEMNAKIAEIEKFKADQEAAILEKILKRNNLKAPTADDFKSIDNAKVTQLDEKAILEDVKFYHTLKLEAIYAERAHFGFTSIQSIADEINFTKLIDPKKSEKLLTEKIDLIINNAFFAKVKTNSNVSLISNSEGKYLLHLKTQNLNIETQDNVNRLIGSTVISGKEGILASNGNYSVTYHVGYSTHKDDIGTTFYGNFTQYGSFVSGALYPSWFYTDANSKCTFSPYGSTSNRTVDFISSAGNIVRNDITTNNLVGNSAYNIVNTSFTNQVSGTYVTVLGGQYIPITGSKNLNQ